MAPAPRRLIVSRATAGFLQRGHPWVRPDRFTRGLEQLQTGEPVVLVDQEGRELAAALADPRATVCARVYDRQPGRPFDPRAAMRAAWARRARWHQDPDTDCYRLVHGEADGLPGLRVERYASWIIVLVSASCAERHVEAVVAELQQLQPQSRILVRLHLEDLRRSSVLDRPIGGWSLDPGEVVLGRELGVVYPLRPAAGLATGLYVDQRATRDRLRSMAQGARVLNLFAYTGAFSICLLRAGALEATDVDISSPALARAAETAALNGVADRHHTSHSDCRKILHPGKLYDLIVIDPPTAAQGGGGWLLRRDYPGLLRMAWGALAAHGLLLACANTVHAVHDQLGGWITDAVAGQGKDETAQFQLAEDVPQVRGFPEGRPFRLAARRKA